jgi:hypothetical protein
MSATQQLAFHHEARGFGFSYEADEHLPIVRIAVDWHGNRVLQVTVNTEEGSQFRLARLSRLSWCALGMQCGWHCGLGLG